MNRLNSILEGIGGAPDDIDNLAAEVGVDPGLVDMAIRMLSETHQMGGDTVKLAAAKTGIDAPTLEAIVEQIGGEASLGHFAAALKSAGSSHTREAVTDIASGLFGKR